MDDFILVSDGKQTYEVELEEDESVTLDSLRSFFGEGAMGLGYNNTTTGRIRILRVDKEAIVRPKAGWDPTRKYVVRMATNCSASGEEFPTLVAENRNTQGLLSVFLMVCFWHRNEVLYF